MVNRASYFHSLRLKLNKNTGDLGKILQGEAGKHELEWRKDYGKLWRIQGALGVRHIPSSRFSGLPVQFLFSAKHTRDNGSKGITAYLTNAT